MKIDTKDWKYVDIIKLRRVAGTVVASLPVDVMKNANMSPEDRVLVAVDFDGNIRIMPLDGGEEKKS